MNSFRVTYNSADIRKDYVPFFDYHDLGIRNVAPCPASTAFMAVYRRFSPWGRRVRSRARCPPRRSRSCDDLSLVRGKHQIGSASTSSVRRSTRSRSAPRPGISRSPARSPGSGLADFLLGRPATFNQGQLYTPRGDMNYVGAYVQDAWTVTPNLTLNAGCAGIPYFPYMSDHGHFNHFSLERFRARRSQHGFRNAPVGVIFEGDPGYRVTRRRISGELRAAACRRLGSAWRRHDDGPRGVGPILRPAAHVELPRVRSEARRSARELDDEQRTFDDPWVNTPGGNPFPIVAQPDMAFPPYGGFVTFPLDMKPPYADQWNVSVQRQIGAASDGVGELPQQPRPPSAGR